MIDNEAISHWSLFMCTLFLHWLRFIKQNPVHSFINLMKKNTHLYFWQQVNNCSCAAGQITLTILIPSHNFNTLMHTNIPCLYKVAFPWEQSPPPVSVSHCLLTLCDISLLLSWVFAFWKHTHTHTNKHTLKEHPSASVHMHYFDIRESPCQFIKAIYCPPSLLQAINLLPMLPLWVSLLSVYQPAEAK